MTPVDEDEREIARAHYDYYCNDRRDLNDPSFGPNAGIGAAGMVRRLLSSITAPESVLTLVDDLCI